MKKIMALVLAVVMMLGTVCLVNAEGTTFTAGDAIAAIKAERTNPDELQTVEKEVAIDIAIRKSEAEGYVDGPLKVTAGKTVDIKADVDLDSVRATVTGYDTLAKSLCAEKNYENEADKEAFMAEVNAIAVSGEFEVVVTYPTQIVVPSAIINGTNLEGFDDNAKALFTEVGRSMVKEDGVRTLTIDLAVKEGIKFGDLAAMLRDFTFVVEGITVSNSGDFKITGDMSGSVEIADIAEINYTAVQAENDDENAEINEKAVNIQASRKVSTSGGNSTSSTGGSTSTKVDPVTVTVNGEEVKVEADKNGKLTLDVDKLEAPAKDYYKFIGWSTDEDGEETVSGKIEVTEDTVLYPQYELSYDKTKAIVLSIDETEADVFGEKKSNDVAPMIKNNRTMLPARFVAESLGAEVAWDEEARQVTITKDDVTIVITIDAETALVNGEEVKLDAPAFIENDRTYTPIRFISEKLGATVLWDAKTEQAIIIVK